MCILLIWQLLLLKITATNSLDSMMKLGSCSATVKETGVWNSFTATSTQLNRTKKIGTWWRTETSAKQAASRAPQSGKLADNSTTHQKIGVAAFLHARTVRDVISPTCQCGWQRQNPKHMAYSPSVQTVPMDKISVKRLWRTDIGIYCQQEFFFCVLASWVMREGLVSLAWLWGLLEFDLLSEGCGCAFEGEVAVDREVTNDEAIVDIDWAWMSLCEKIVCNTVKFQSPSGSIIWHCQLH